jgi:DNA polymerase III alpha subunit
MFVHLHCHSHYSFLRGVNPPDELIAAAVEQKMPAVALTDTNGMYAAVGFCQAAKTAGVKPIVGITLEVEASSQLREVKEIKEVKEKSELARISSGKDWSSSSFTSYTSSTSSVSPPATLVLLAMDATGYSNLCQLTTLRHLGVLRLGQETFAEEAGRPVTLEELAAHSAGVIALWPANEILRGDWRASAKAPASEGGRYMGSHLQSLKDIFGDRLYIEVQHLLPGDGRILREAQRLGRASRIPLVATNNVYFVKPGEHLHHRAVNAVRTGNLLTTITPPFEAQGKPEITTPEAWFKPAAEMQKLFPDHPELLRATLEIAERCNLQLELGKLILPEFPVPKGNTPSSFLAKLCTVGAAKRYPSPGPEVFDRLTHELRVIDHWKLAPYFLLVWDIVQEAQRRGIPAVARGSAASSMVTYCLGISRVCPIRWGLYFERFLNEQRGDCPDIDIDICGARRDELLDYVYARWGPEHVAMIGSFITMHARLAVREIAKVFGVPPGEVNHFTKRLPHRPVRDILEAIKHLPEGRTLPVNDEPWKTILQVALRLDGAPRHLGIHPCGTVISARPLTHLAPLERATKGIVVTQYDMNAIEALGLIKMDLLGQRGLTTMALALDNIEKSGEWRVASGEREEVKEVKEIKEVKEKEGVRTGDALPDKTDLSLRSARPSSSFTSLASFTSFTSSTSSVAADGVTPCPKARTIDFAAIPENDPETCEVVSTGKTLGIFQIESPAMRGMLRLMKARTLEEMAIALAIIRPGAAEYGSKELFVKRMRGKEPVVYVHPALEPILKDTLGVCVYQEQVMQIAQSIGSMSLAEADLVRRTSVKYAGRADYERLRGKFEKAAEWMGMNVRERKEAWMMVEKFAGFGFCKAHAGTYADISYRMAYLKTHHTAEFLAAMCSAGAGFYHVSAYVEEAKRWGIEIRLPSVNHSRMEYTAECIAADTTAGRASPAPTKALRIGLMQVRGLRIETIVGIVRERDTRGIFRSLEDFLARVPVERDEIEALIKCGAFDDACGMTRPAMLWQWNLLQIRRKEVKEVKEIKEVNEKNGLAGSSGNKISPSSFTSATALSSFASSPSSLATRHSSLATSSVVAGMLFEEMQRDTGIAEVLQEMETPEYTREQKLRYEREILEVCVSGHPLDSLPRNGEAWSDELPGLRGKRVTLCGWVVTHRHVGTKNYRNMMFVTLEDQRGLFEVILFPDVYDKYGGLVYETRAMRITGVVMEGEHINGERLESLK